MVNVCPSANGLHTGFVINFDIKWKKREKAIKKVIISISHWLHARTKPLAQYLSQCDGPLCECQSSKCWCVCTFACSAFVVVAICHSAVALRIAHSVYSLNCVRRVSHTLSPRTKELNKHGCMQKKYKWTQQ